MDYFKNFDCKNFDCKNFECKNFDCKKSDFKKLLDNKKSKWMIYGSAIGNKLFVIFRNIFFCI